MVAQFYCSRLLIRVCSPNVRLVVVSPGTGQSGEALLPGHAVNTSM